MHIICPHCTTSYAINPATLGTAGRTVRCSRCKETWLARPEDAIEMADAMPAAMPNPAQPAAAANDAAAEWEALAREEEGQDTPVVDSPSISAGWPAEGEASQPGGDSDWPSAARQDAEMTRKSRSPRTASGWPVFSGCHPCPASPSCRPLACRPPAPRWAR